MNNPWEEIKLDDYEKHMSLDSVKQLQTMNKMMKDAGYQKILEETESLPNGKALLRIDFKKGKEQTYGIN